MVTTDVVVIHGAGTGAYEEDALLAESLRRELGPRYRVRFPRMRDENEPAYEAWRGQIEAELANAPGDVMLVGHSFGGSVVLKFLIERSTVARVAGAFVIAAPFWGADAFWSWDAGRLPDAAAARLARVPRLHLYHARDDEIVPFAHLGMLAAALPAAVVHELEAGGHQLGNDLSQVARDIVRG